ncbi:MAG: excinuclease ABC subunit UvrA, partial [Pseudomonadota bacterium]
DEFSKLCSEFSQRTLLIGFEHTIAKDSESRKTFLEDMLRSGYSRVIIDESVQSLESLLTLKKLPKSPWVFVVDRLKLPPSPEPSSLTRFTESIKSALEFGRGLAQLLLEKEGKYQSVSCFTPLTHCPKCKLSSPPKKAISFSFNSPLGACETCKGFGNTLEVDEQLVIPDGRLSVSQGAIDPFTKPSLRHWQKKLLEFCKSERIDVDLPFKVLPPEARVKIFKGHKKFVGVKGVFDLLNEEKYKMRIRVFVSRYVSPFECTTCHGSRLNTNALSVKVSNKNLADLFEMTVGELLFFIQTLKLSKKEAKICEDIIQQLLRRLNTLNTVGLGYLTLARQTRTLSGGEYQRILLGTQLSQGLTDTLYVLDEPSIGLHPQDTQKLLSVLKNLKDQGNTLVIVEHDPEIIEWGDFIVDMGPGSGSKGGALMFSGARAPFLKHPGYTAKAVRDWREECRDSLLRKIAPLSNEWLDVQGASGNNLKNIHVKIPLTSLVAVTGVSGSGKSTLIVDTVYQALSKLFLGKSDKIAKFESISGFEHLSGVELVDQSPIGKSSRSNPITFIKGYDEIRSLFAHTPDAQRKKFGPGHFSFNVASGRCETCDGEGRVKIDMVFMEDVWVSCATCDGKRFKKSILAIRYRNRNIDDVLRMTIDEAYEFFIGITSLRTKLALLREVGLGYLQLGQPGFSLSGGEAQRLKIARELSQASSSTGSTLFILDEPTTGLHFHEISKLIGVLRRLVSHGHSVIVIEHNLQLICASDYLIDLGPDGGSGGGTVVAVGTPKELAQKKLPQTGKYLSDILYQSEL